MALRLSFTKVGHERGLMTSGFLVKCDFLALAPRHYGPEKYLGFSISRGVKTPLHIRTMSTWKTSKKSPFFFLVLHDSPLYVNYADKSMSTCKTCTFVHLSSFFQNYISALFNFGMRYKRSLDCIYNTSN